MDLAHICIADLKETIQGSGCGSVGRLAASYTWDLWFKSTQCDELPFGHLQQWNLPNIKTFLPQYDQNFAKY